MSPYARNELPVFILFPNIKTNARNPELLEIGK